MLFVHLEIGYRQSFITALRISFFFFFLIYELNVVVSIHCNIFYPCNIDFENAICKLFLGKICYDLLVVQVFYFLMFPKKIKELGFPEKRFDFL